MQISYIVDYQSPIHKQSVYECLFRQSGERAKNVCAKIMEFDDQNQAQNTLQVYQLQYEQKHKNIVEVLNISFENCNGKYLLTIFMKKYVCDLQSFIEKKPKKFRVDENFPDAIVLLEQLLNGYEFLYKNQIAHRDIKPGNILVEINGGQINYYLNDFDSAQFYQEKMRCNFWNTTKLYSAPEIANCSSDSNIKFAPKTFDEFVAQDIYSIGLSLYHFFFQKLPFDSNKTQLIFFNDRIKGTKIPKNEYEIFIEKIIHVDYKQRITFEKLKEETEEIVRVQRKLALEKQQQQRMNQNIPFQNTNNRVTYPITNPMFAQNQFQGQNFAIRLTQPQFPTQAQNQPQQFQPFNAPNNVQNFQNQNQTQIFRQFQNNPN